MFLYDRNFIGSSSEIFGISEIFGNDTSDLWTTFGESSENRQKFVISADVYIINRIIHGCFVSHGISSRVLNLIPHERA